MQSQYRSPIRETYRYYIVTSSAYSKLSTSDCCSLTKSLQFQPLHIYWQNFGLTVDTAMVNTPVASMQLCEPGFVAATQGLVSTLVEQSHWPLF